MIVQRVWAARDYAFKSKPFATKITLIELQGYMKMPFGNPQWEGQPWSLSTIERAMRQYPALLPKSMLRRWATRPWERKESESESLPLKPDDSPVVLKWTAFDADGNQVTVEAVGDENGVVRFIKQVLPSATAIAASIAALVALDGLDGHIDHVVHWCRVALELTSIVKV